MFMSLNTRISQLIEYTQLSLSEFADKVDVQRSSISHITSGRNKPSLDFLIKVKDTYPLLRWEWLIEGEGPMLEQESSTPTNQIPTPTSPADLFALINDENFGRTESEDTLQALTSRMNFETPPESTELPQDRAQEATEHSQRLETNASANTFVSPNSKPLKRIILFFQDGSFESYEQ